MTLFGKGWWFRAAGHGVGGGIEDKAKSLGDVHKGLEKPVTGDRDRLSEQNTICDPAISTNTFLKMAFEVDRKRLRHINFSSCDALKRHASRGEKPATRYCDTGMPR